MGGKRKQTSQAVEGLTDRDLRSFVAECGRVSREALGINNRQVGFNEVNVSRRNEKVYLLEGGGATPARAKYNYKPIPFHFAQTTTLWLSISLKFVFRAGLYYVTEVSLIVFEGEGADPEKMPLLRAEWDSLVEESHVSHAQPHWHIYSSRIARKAEATRAIFEIEETALDFQAGDEEQRNGKDIEWERGERFHFAMAARWHEVGDESHQETIHKDKIAKWLEGCIRYTHRQLEYLYPTTSDFRK